MSDNKGYNTTNKELITIEELCMKIVFVIPNMTGGGTERVISLLANEYVSRGIEVAIMMFAGDESAYILDTRIELFSISEQSYGNPRIQLMRLWKMRKYFRENKGCYIFSFSVMGTIFSAATILGLGCTLFVSERNDPRKGRQGLLRNIAYSRAIKIAVQTKECISYFPKFLQKKILVIANPIDISLPEAFLGKRKKTVVFVGRLHKQKNPDLLLSAFAEFVKDFNDYKLHIYGKGELEEELKIKGRQLGIHDRVIWHGFCPDARMQIVDAGMYVLPSDFEGISNSMLEAMAMGIPVIATDCPIGGAAAYIDNSKNGLLIPVGDKDSLVKAMKRLAADAEFSSFISFNAVQIRKQYPLQKIADKMMEAAGIR